MARLINNRYYFDYNATSPLADSVKDWFPNGDLLFANPSSIHSSGKKSKRFINETKKYLEKLFSLDSTFRIFFHSGASEGVNSLVKGFAQKSFAANKKVHFIHSHVDHSCVFNLKDELELYGHEVSRFGVDANGEYDIEEVISLINKSSAPTLLNFTWVNNENGVVWNLEDLSRIKKETNCYIHVDAVQSIGKIEEWKKLNLIADAYTFSGHKFGAMKGIGFSFVKEDFPFCSLIRGGGQQEGMRSGTENTNGIYSLKLALEELCERENFSKLNEAKTFIESEIEKVLDSKAFIVSKNAKSRNANTIYLVIPGKKADILITAFDLARMDVSSGSACSSGAVLPSRVLQAMGVNEEDAKSALRFSFAYDLSLEESKEYSEKIITVLKRFL
ncbi:putative cysteine desulfurase [Halobacteriovorax marinus SJ]|uniref:Cysteine desulfurase n=1 Tax=Halobacteriovorax marinus (strain ATCC BAA-682 / DSM 15412 / SJ) TaxID=862908 RepID=E1X3J7_HALMS|nr:aminotransferase class V-fold PLP-dependent enzyme [Halobacteriovorax marinus]CBW26926.1 putative cysteine desulfurase [Halobacteriovorax marinus SJ]